MQIQRKSNGSAALRIAGRLIFSFPCLLAAGGFVIESLRTGTFKRFSETKVMVLSVSVTEEQHAELKEMLDVMWKRRRKYSYNYIGLCLAYFHVVWKQEGC